MNKEKIINVLKQLYTVSGFRVSLHNTAFEEIAAYPEEKNRYCDYIQKSSHEAYRICRECDRAACEHVLKTGETYIYRCGHGLTEAISPLYNFGALTGFLMMGQVRPVSDSSACEVLESYGAPKSLAKEIANEVPVITREMLDAFVSIMTICARYLTLSNAITGSKPSIAELTMQFIHENYTEHISVMDICNAIGYSKSTVLSQFKKEFHTTVNAYINNMRLERAKKMLENNALTVSEIALGCGFSDQSYFSKVFSSKYGISPTDYRKER